MNQKLRYGYYTLNVVLILHTSIAFAQSTCRIIKMITPQQTEYHFQYDGQRRLQLVTSPAENLVDSFFYYTDSIVIARSINNKPDSKITYSFNENGQAMHQKFMPVGYEGWIEDIDYGYKDGRLTTVTRTVRLLNQRPEEATVSTEKFIWKNGNPVKVSHTQKGQSSGSVTMQYYTDKKFCIGDYQSYEQIMTGICVLNPAHLLKKCIGPETLNLSYEFDVKGNITSMIEKEENDTRITKYEYECR